MKLQVSYTIYKEVEVEITEEMIRELYNQFKGECNWRSIHWKISDAIDEYIEQKSGYIKDNGCHLEYLDDIDQWLDKTIDKIEMEEE